MERFIQLNLQSDYAKAGAPNLTVPERKDPAAAGRKLNRIANKVAHKAATEFSRSRTILFSK